MQTAQPESADAVRTTPVKPLVSVGLPVFNGERYLEQALDSLLRQTFEDFELVISDNGSTDRTPEICRSYAARDERIRYLREETNRGASWNFGKVFLETSAPLFRWASHDDLYEPTHLERCVDVLSHAPAAVVLCYPKTRLIDGDGQSLGVHEDRLDLRDPIPARRLRRLVANVVYVNALFGLIRREALTRTRLLQAFLGSDWVLLAELALLGQFWEIPEPLFLRRLHDEMSMRANPTPRALAAWFDPAASRQGNRVLCHLLGQHLAAIHRAPLPLATKSTLYPALMGVWLKRHRRGMACELLPDSLARRLRPTT